LQWVYRKTSTGYELLLSAGPVDEITPLKTITNGYRDLKVIAPVGNSATIQTHRFDGRRYTNQKIAQRGSEGSQDWSSFFSTFRTAAQNHDRMAIRNMMSPNFEYGVETESRDNALKYMNEANGGWADLNKVLTRGIVPFRKSGRQAYVAPPTGNSRTYKGWSAVFELGEDGRWHWTAFRFPD
jgi:hypothetical protein